MPLEYLELILCRDVYHCPPSQLPDWKTISIHLQMMEIESQIREQRNRSGRK
jgi:hypothetical protein